MEEIWKDIAGYEGLYQVSNLGRVKMLRRVIKCGHGNNQERIFLEKIMSLCFNIKKYYIIRLTNKGIRKTISVHRLVAEAFIPNPESKPQVNHINGIKSDNRVENLEWNTGSENIKHAFDTGLMFGKKGENIGNSKLTEQDVLEIRASNEYQKVIAKRYGVSPSLISAIKRKVLWKHI